MTSVTVNVPKNFQTTRASTESNTAQPELSPATCNEKLMWKLLPPRTKWKTEHFRSFFMERCEGGWENWRIMFWVCRNFSLFVTSSNIPSIASVYYVRLMLRWMRWCNAATSAFGFFFFAVPPRQKKKNFHGTHSHNFPTQSCWIRGMSGVGWDKARHDIGNVLRIQIHALSHSNSEQEAANQSSR